ncbi:MAG: hypothetical protein OXI58_21220 [Gemmatimonadota bacterium]|nr:hypothetical protein [Gemmatimonadota bacterium]
MTVIHTTDDLIRLLNENDEFRQAVRRHVLSDELIQLPERLAKFETHVEDFIGEQRQFNKEQRQSNKEQRQFNKEQRQFNQRMENSIGELRGNTARQVVSTHFIEIAEGMGFRCKGILMRADLVQMLTHSERDDIPHGDRQSFFRADLVVEATDSDGAMHYIAVEASYTADQRDTSRAQRNAALLTRFTGHPAHAAIASVRNVHEIQSLIDDGTVYWHALDPADFTPE